MVPVFSAHCKSLTGNQKASQINTFIFMAASWHCLFCFNPKFLYIYYYITYIYMSTHTYIYIYIISYIIYMISGKCSKNWHFFPPTPCFFLPVSFPAPKPSSISGAQRRDHERLEEGSVLGAWNQPFWRFGCGFCQFYVGILVKWA